ncbi:putative uridine nucleosidase 2, partial [Pseudolycoriella hygida]
LRKQHASEGNLIIGLSQKKDAHQFNLKVGRVKTSDDTAMINDSTELIIFDTDPGIDDAWALLMLLKAEKVRNIKVLAITLVHGNTTVDYAVDNCLRTLKCIDRTDVPIYKGARESLIPQCTKLAQFFGTDGFGDMTYDNKPEQCLIQKEHAVTAMERLYPGRITFICVGPLTNMALAIKMYPDFSNKIKALYLMGGNYNERIYFIEKYDVPHEWRIDELGTIQNKITKLLNEPEIKIFQGHKCNIWNPCDAILIAIFLKPDEIIEKSKYCYATVELAGTFTRGQVAIDHLNKQKKNITIVEKVDVEK